MPSRDCRLRGRIANATLGSLLFGYNVSVINTIIPDIASSFNWTTPSEVACGAALASSSLFLGAVFGSILSGQLCAQWGRRHSLIACHVTFACASVSGTLSIGTWTLAASRAVAGIAVGGASVLVPLYIYEVSHVKRRGHCCVVNQVVITLGVFLGAAMGVVHQKRSLDVLNCWWQVMVGWSAIPSLMAVCLFVFVFVLDTPYFYVLKHYDKSLSRPSPNQVPFYPPEDTPNDVACGNSGTAQEGPMTASHIGGGPSSSIQRNELRLPSDKDSTITVFADSQEATQPESVWGVPNPASSPELLKAYFLLVEIYSPTSSSHQQRLRPFLNSLCTNWYSRLTANHSSTCYSTNRAVPPTALQQLDAFPDYPPFVECAFGLVPSSSSSTVSSLQFIDSLLPQQQHWPSQTTTATIATAPRPQTLVGGDTAPSLVLSYTRFSCSSGDTSLRPLPTTPTASSARSFPPAVPPIPDLPDSADATEQYVAICKDVLKAFQSRPPPSLCRVLCPCVPKLCGHSGVSDAQSTTSLGPEVAYSNASCLRNHEGKQYESRQEEYVCSHSSLPTTAVSTRHSTCSAPSSPSHADSRHGLSKHRVALFSGAGVSLLQQLTGINAFLAASTSLFTNVGVSHQTATFCTLAVGLVNLLSTLPAAWLIEQWGRKKLLLFGVWGQCLSLLPVVVVIGVESAQSLLADAKGVADRENRELAQVYPFSGVTQTETKKYVAVCSIVAFVIAFALGLGPVPPVYLNEIFTEDFKGKAIGFCFSLNWGAAFCVVFTAQVISTDIAFIAFFTMSLVAALFAHRFVIETVRRAEEVCHNQNDERTSVGRGCSASPAGA